MQHKKQMSKPAVKFTLKNIQKNTSTITLRSIPNPISSSNHHPTAGQSESKIEPLDCQNLELSIHHTYNMTTFLIHSLLDPQNVQVYNDILTLIILVLVNFNGSTEHLSPGDIYAFSDIIDL